MSTCESMNATRNILLLSVALFHGRIGTSSLN